MLLVDLYCPFCETYSFFQETLAVTLDIPMFSMAGFTLEPVTYEMALLRCILCRRTAEPVDDAWSWLYWYAWWGGNPTLPEDDLVR